MPIFITYLNRSILLFYLYGIGVINLSLEKQDHSSSSGDDG